MCRLDKAYGRLALHFTSSHRQSSGASLWGGNWTLKLLAAIGIRLYGAALNRDTSFRRMYEVCNGKTPIRNPLEKNTSHTNHVH
ncbi:hypothetical protein TNCV_4059751 [Trichonephila clavipes]|nr:hypothetical protein TNCV_4059751 [Trichonephila clavipes]